MKTKRRKRVGGKTFKSDGVEWTPQVDEVQVKPFDRMTRNEKIADLQIQLERVKEQNLQLMDAKQLSNAEYRTLSDEITELKQQLRLAHRMLDRLLS